MSGGSFGFFRCEPSEVGKEERLKFIALKTDDGRITGKISFYCRAFDVTRQAFYDYLERKSKHWKYKLLVEEMMKIHNEDMYNDTYGRKHMYIALKLKSQAGGISVHISSESTVRKVMEQIN